MAIFGWGGRRRRPTADDRSTPTDRPPTARPEDAEIDAAVRTALVPGFRSEQQVIDAVLSSLRPRGVMSGVAEPVPDEDPALRSRVVTRTSSAWASARRTEASGVDAEAAPADARLDVPTGHDRLVAAFRTLEREHGIRALMGLGVDVRAALAAIDRDHECDPGPWAFVCFSLQDADALASPPADLLLTFGVFRADPAIDPDLVAAAGESVHATAAIRERSTLAAGSAIVSALTEHGLPAEWEGEAGQPVVVRIEDWRRPLPFASVEEAREVADAEGLRVSWPDDQEAPGADMVVVRRVEEGWRVWSTDARGAPTSPGVAFPGLGAVLDRAMALARAARRRS